MKDSSGKDASRSPGMIAKQAHRWEMIGLAVVVLAGSLILGGLYLLVDGRRRALARERRDAAAGKVAEVIPVMVQVLKPQMVIDRIRLPGMVDAWLDVEVPAEVSGKVIASAGTPLPDGSPVKKGQVILRIEPRDYVIALQRAKAGLLLARENFRRTRNLVRQGVKTPSDLDRDTSGLEQAEARVAAARLALARCEVKSPLDGVVDDVVPEVGEYLRPGAMVARVLELSRVRVEVGIPECDVNAVRGLVRAHALIDLDISSASKGRTLRGRCIYLSEAPRKNALVYTLRLEVDNREGLLRPGMFVRADVVKARRPGSVVIPLLAVLPRGDEHFVFVAQGTNRAEKGAVSAGESARKPAARARKVVLGVMMGSRVEIVSGLSLGEQVIVVGQRSVGDGTLVRITRTIDDLSELER